MPTSGVGWLCRFNVQVDTSAEKNQAYKLAMMARAHIILQTPIIDLKTRTDDQTSIP
jgi:hypothetical protein